MIMRVFKSDLCNSLSFFMFQVPMRIWNSQNGSTNAEIPFIQPFMIETKEPEEMVFDISNDIIALKTWTGEKQTNFSFM